MAVKTSYSGEPVKKVISISVTELKCLGYYTTTYYWFVCAPVCVWSHGQAK